MRLRRRIKQIYIRVINIFIRYSIFLLFPIKRIDMKNKKKIIISTEDKTALLLLQYMANDLDIKHEDKLSLQYFNRIMRGDYDVTKSKSLEFIIDVFNMWYPITKLLDLKSGLDVVVFKKKDEKKLIICIDGTDMSKGRIEVGDIKTNIKIYFNMLFNRPMSVGIKQLTQSYGIIKNILSKYKGYDIVVTGFSLGGFLAQNVCVKFGLKNGIFFNSFDYRYKQIEYSPICKSYIIINDVIGRFGKGMCPKYAFIQHRVDINRLSFKYHSLYNFFEFFFERENIIGIKY